MIVIVSVERVWIDLWYYNELIELVWRNAWYHDVQYTGKNRKSDNEEGMEEL